MMTEAMGKERSEIEMRGALQRFIDGNRQMRIPAHPDDDDLILCDAITEVMAQRAARDVTATIPPYHAQSPCPKCRNQENETRYVSARAAENFGNLLAGFGVEHIERICRRCSYRWAESPLDVVISEDE